MNSTLPGMGLVNSAPALSAPGLLVSVRSITEARDALAGGADIIDVKEPLHGPLGRADGQIITGILDDMAGRRPVSAAQGELREYGPSPIDGRLTFVKWGLAGLRIPPGQRNGCVGGDWRTLLEAAFAHVAGPQVVVAAYADWECAQAPPVDDVVAFACLRPGRTLLLDTHCKDASVLGLGRRPSLLDWLPAPWVIDICRRCRDAGCRIALAGSLGAAEMEQLLPARPDWFAIRGAACHDAERGAAVDRARVAQLKNWLRSCTK